jgi:hypothetical protein
MIQNQTYHYLHVREKDKGFTDGVRGFMQELFKNISIVRRISGGKDGDMHQETAEWNLFYAGSDGRVELYTVTDDSTNGYCECISVICCSLDEESEKVQKLRAYLEKHDFVNKYTSFEKRPFGYKSFVGYLSNPYRPSREYPFATQNGSGD